jgi:hypothetical protein
MPSAMGAAPEFADLLKVLVLHEVDFILVGGVAAILQGAPVSTFDLDIVPRRTDENLDRLLAALQEVGAPSSDPAGRHLVPDADKVRTLRTQRLLTDDGPLDVMESIGQRLTYEDLVGQTHVYEVNGLALRVLDLATIILSKEQANRDKNRATLPILRRTLRLRGGG